MISEASNFFNVTSAFDDRNQTKAHNYFAFEDKTAIQLLKMSGNIVTIDDQVRSSVYHNDSVTFNYELNDKSAKAKLVKGSKRTPFEFEKKSTSFTLVFSVGAWLADVLPAVRYWNEIKGDKTCEVGDKVIKVSGIKSGKDVNGMCVVSQVVFYSIEIKLCCISITRLKESLLMAMDMKILFKHFYNPSLKINSGLVHRRYKTSTQR